jgi:5-hydroxyisourate hydrolase
MSRATISTHVLDVSRGAPVAGVAVKLGSAEARVTDADGRIADLGAGGVELGSHRIEFELGGYFGGRPHLFDRVAFVIEVAEARHYHVPLLITPFSCSFYRGS